MKMSRSMVLLLLCAVFVFFAFACNQSGGPTAEPSESDGAFENGDDTVTEKETEKKTDKKTEKETRPIMDTQPPTTLENTDGLELNLKILTQNVRYADDPDGNSVKERTTRFKALIDEYRPDVIGTQEVTFEWYNYLDTIEGYALVGESKTGKQGDDGDWNLIMYDVERFVLMDSDTFWLTGTPDKVSKLDGATVVRICTWAELFDRYTGETIIVANTHIDHKSTDLRVLQLKYMLKHLRDRLFERYEGCRIYVTGDFNCLVDSRPYEVMEDRGFVDSRSVTLEDNSTVNASYHGYNGQEYMFDYCFFKGDDTVLSYEIISTNYIGEMDTEPGYVSDHYGVITVFERKSVD